MLNHIVLQGRCVKDPELRHTQSGTAVATVTIAVDRDYQSGGNERQTDFIQLVAWRKTGEFISKYFSKGSMILVEGALQSRKYQDKNGNDRVAWEVVASQVHFGDSKKDNGESQNETFTELDDSDGQLPF